MIHFGLAFEYSIVGVTITNGALYGDTYLHEWTTTYKLTVWRLIMDLEAPYFYRRLDILTSISCPLSTGSRRWLISKDAVMPEKSERRHRPPYQLVKEKRPPLSSTPWHTPFGMCQGVGLENNGIAARPVRLPEVPYLKGRSITRCAI